MSCLFCKILNKEIPSTSVYEDDLVYAFLDISPLSKGHTLVVLKEHTISFLETDAAKLAILFEKVKEVSNILIKEYKTSSFQYLINQGITQEVKHLHVHIIPIYDEADSILKNS